MCLFNLQFVQYDHYTVHPGLMSLWVSVNSVPVTPECNSKVETETDDRKCEQEVKQSLTVD